MAGDDKRYKGKYDKGGGMAMTWSKALVKEGPEAMAHSQRVGKCMFRFHFQVL